MTNYTFTQNEWSVTDWHCTLNYEHCARTLINGKIVGMNFVTVTKSIYLHIVVNCMYLFSPFFVQHCCLRLNYRLQLPFCYLNGFFSYENQISMICFYSQSIKRSKKCEQKNKRWTSFLKSVKSFAFGRKSKVKLSKWKTVFCRSIVFIFDLCNMKPINYSILFFM